MPRRGSQGPLLEVLEIAPAWVGPVIAVVIFVGCRYVLPPWFASIASGTPYGSIGETFSALFFMGAPLAGGLVLLLWIGAEVRKRLGRRLHDKQTGAESIRSLSWPKFECLVAEAFRRKGYVVEETGHAAGDGGVDLVLTKGHQTLLVQCKHWKAWKVGVQPVRELLGVVASQGAQAGILVTSGWFTREAHEFAEGNPIRLIDGKALALLILGAKDVGPAYQPPKPTDSRPKADSGQPASPECPKCGGPMVLRTARKGLHAGKPFWGCTNFPPCRGIRDAR